MEKALMYEPNSNIVEERRIFGQAQDKGWAALQEFYYKEIAKYGWNLVIGMAIGVHGINGYTMSSLLDTPMPPSTFIHISGHFVHQARNEIAKRALKLDSNWTHILWVDSDVSFPRYAIPRMLRHDVDSVSALCCLKKYPVKYVVFEKDMFLPTGGMRRIELEMKGKPWMIKPEYRDRLLRVGGSGFALTLHKRAIYEKMEDPYFSDYDTEDGRFMGEDVLFYKQINKLGFKAYADTSLVCEHWLNPSMNLPGMFMEGGRYILKP